MLCPLKAVSNYSWELGKLIGGNLRNVRGFLRNFHLGLNYDFVTFLCKHWKKLSGSGPEYGSNGSYVNVCIILEEDPKIAFVFVCIWLVHHHHHRTLFSSSRLLNQGQGKVRWWSGCQVISQKFSEKSLKPDGGLIRSSLRDVSPRTLGSLLGLGWGWA